MARQLSFIFNDNHAKYADSACNTPKHRRRNKSKSPKRGKGLLPSNAIDRDPLIQEN